MVFNVGLDWIGLYIYINMGMRLFADNMCSFFTLFFPGFGVAFCNCVQKLSISFHVLILPSPLYTNKHAQE